jgi:hypothetical protein
VRESTSTGDRLKEPTARKHVNYPSVRSREVENAIIILFVLDVT